MSASGPQGGRPLSAPARRVQDALAAGGFPWQVIELPVAVRTAAEAAQHVGCSVGQIAKSIVFRAARSGRGVLVVTSGVNRVDEGALAARIGEPLGKADAAFVREATGFVIGGVPPLGHATELITFVDQDLLRHAEIWAAAGHPNSLFRLDPADLPRMTGGPAIQVTA